MESKKIEKLCSANLNRRQFLKGMGILGAGAYAFGSSMLVGCGPKESNGSNGSKQGKKTVLTIRHSSTYTKEGEEKYQDMGTYAFQELVEKYSNGEMVVEVYPSDQLGSQKEVAEKIQAGALEVCRERKKFCVNGNTIQ